MYCVKTRIDYSKAAKIQSKRAVVQYREMVPVRVVGDPPYVRSQIRTCYIRRYAKANLYKRTNAEKRLRKILLGHTNKLLWGFAEQHVISGKWIVDFFYSDVRLAIEVDGTYHRISSQLKKDSIKEIDCSRFDITLIRLTNSEIFNNDEHVISKILAGRDEAHARKNNIIGTIY